MADQNPPGLIAQVDQELTAARHSVEQWVQNWRDAPATLTGQDKIVSLCQEIMKHDPQWVILWLATAVERLAELGDSTLRPELNALAAAWQSRADTCRVQAAPRAETYDVCVKGLRALLDGA